jgi:putative ABC transport system ATP-binding protein
MRLKEFGFVFQQPFLVGYLTAEENARIAAPMVENGSRLRTLLDEMGIAEKAHRMPSELSGGEKQRICVARALYRQPRVIFADEPTASLDHASGLQVVNLLRDHHEGALVMVTHDPSMLTRADRVLRMDEGRIFEAAMPGG